MKYKGYRVQLDAFEAKNGGWIGAYDATPIESDRPPLGLSGATLSGYTTKDSALDAAFDLCKRRIDKVR